MTRSFVLKMTLALAPLFAGALAVAAEPCAPLSTPAGSIVFVGDKIVVKTKKVETRLVRLSQPAPECTSLKDSKLKDHVVVEFWGGFEGTSRLKNTHYWGLLDLKKQRWGIKPQAIETTVKDAQGDIDSKIAELTEVSEADGYHVERKNLETGEKEVVFEDKKTSPEKGRGL